MPRPKPRRGRAAHGDRPRRRLRRLRVRGGRGRRPRLASRRASSPSSRASAWPAADTNDQGRPATPAEAIAAGATILLLGRTVTAADRPGSGGTSALTMKLPQRRTSFARFMPSPPQLSPEARAAALEKAAIARRARAELKQQLRLGSLTFRELHGQVQGRRGHRKDQGAGRARIVARPRQGQGPARARRSRRQRHPSHPGPRRAQKAKLLDLLDGPKP